MILSSVSITLLFLRNNLIPFHQSSNFVQSLSNHLGSSTIFFGNPAWQFSWPVTFISASASAGAVNISVSVCLLFVLSFEVSICKYPSRSDNALILSVHLELIVVLSCSFCYTCFVPDRYLCLVSSLGSFLYTYLAR